MKRYFSLYLLPFLLVLFSSCSEQSSQVKIKNIEVQWGSIEIATEGNSLALSCSPVIYNSDGIEYYVSYNDFSNSLHFYNLESKKFSKKIDFFNSGPNFIQGFSTYNIFRDTVIFRCTETIKLINSEGVIVDELNLSDMCPELDSSYSLRGRGGLMIVNLRRIHINETAKSIIIRTYNKENGYQDIYKNPVFVEYFFDSNHGIPHYVKFPDELNNRFFGDLEYPNIISKGDSILYNFPFKATIYIYNKKNGAITEKPFKANHIPSTVKSADLSRKSDMLLKREFMLGDKFHQIEYDPYRDLFFLLYSQKKVDKDPTLRHLIVFDDDFQKIDEIKLPQGLSPKFVISKKGLLFRNVGEDSFETLKLHVMTINLN